MAIERKFVDQNMREFRIKRFVEENVQRVGLSDVKLKKTPLGDKIVIHASRPGLVVGRGGASIQLLTRQLKEEFNLDNPQIEIEEIANPDLDADIVAERVLNTLERFGSGRTKSIGHRAMADTIRAGALGVEIIISGKIPSMRAKSWRFYQGYLKKAGDIAVEGVDKSIKSVTLKSGAVGIRVSIMPPGLVLPDNITLTEQLVTEVEEVTGTPEALETEEIAQEPAKETTTEAETAEVTTQAEPSAEDTEPKAEQSVSEEQSSDAEEKQ